jgi:hypothetical protein
MGVTRSLLVALKLPAYSRRASLRGRAPGRGGPVNQGRGTGTIQLKRNFEIGNGEVVYAAGRLNGRAAVLTLPGWASVTKPPALKEPLDLSKHKRRGVRPQK